MISALFSLFRGRPVHPVGADGRMALSDHLRELRARILRVAFVMLATLIASLFFFDHLYELVYGPYREASRHLSAAATQAARTTRRHGRSLRRKSWLPPWW